MVDADQIPSARIRPDINVGIERTDTYLETEDNKIDPPKTTRDVAQAWSSLKEKKAEKIIDTENADADDSANATPL